MRSLLSALFVMVSTFGSAQDFAKASDPAKSLETIKAFTKDVKSFRSSFEQTKELAMMTTDLKSSGALAYSEDLGMRWEYTAPNASVLIMTEEKTMLKEESGVRDLASTNAIMKRVEKMVESCLDGSILSDDSYKTKVYESESHLKAELLPQKRRMKEMASSIEIVFSKENGVLSTLSLTDAAGDKTIVQFSEPSINGKMDSGLFKLE